MKNNIELKVIIGDENKLEYIVGNVNNPSKDNSLIENRLLNIFQQYQGQSIQFCASKAFLETKNWKSEMNDIRRKYLKNQQWWNLYEKFTKEELNATRSKILSEFKSYRLQLKNNPEYLDELLNEIFAKVLFIPEAKLNPKIADLQLALNTIVFPEFQFNTNDSTFDFLDIALDVLDND